MTGRLLLIGHRGSAGTAPENTLPSFQAAADAGADMVELDVRLTADGSLVVMHDMSLSRTTGIRRRVCAAGAQDVAGLEAGSWFDRRFRGVGVPLLADVLVWRPPGLGLNIEVKTQGDPRGGRAYIRPLLTLLEGTPSRRLLVSSFDDRFLAQLHRASLRTPIGCLYVPARDRGRGPAGLARATGAHVFICSAGQARPALVRAAQEGGLRVFVYGVNTAAVARSVRALGAAGVITDVPARLQRMLNRSGRSL